MEENTQVTMEMDILEELLTEVYLAGVSLYGEPGKEIEAKAKETSELVMYRLKQVVNK